MQNSVRPATPRTITQPLCIVWIDSDAAVIARLHGDEPVLDHLASDVPAHHHGTDFVRHDPRVRHGGGGAAEDRIERARQERLRRHLREVAARLDPAENVLVLGPGTVRTQLTTLLRHADRGAGRIRDITTDASGLMSDPQLAALLREANGRPAPRRRVG